MSEKAEEILVSKVTAYGRNLLLACDRQCQKAWGINSRPRNPDNDLMLADAELSDAPVDPGTYEGTDGKPTDRLHNKWCFRECERSVSCDESKLPNLAEAPLYDRVGD